MAKKILVVDDEPHIVKLVEMRLKASGYDVISSHDGRQCLDMVRSEKPDLIILDLMLPSLNGYEVCHALRSDPVHKNIPIVMLSAKGKFNDMKTGLEKGVDAYVAKPFKTETLLGILKGLLGE